MKICPVCGCFSVPENYGENCPECAVWAIEILENIGFQPIPENPANVYIAAFEGGFQKSRSEKITSPDCSHLCVDIVASGRVGLDDVCPSCVHLPSVLLGGEI